LESKRLVSGVDCSFAFPERVDARSANWLTIERPLGWQAARQLKTSIENFLKITYKSQFPKQLREE
jgi:hypothetical protein